MVLAISWQILSTTLSTACQNFCRYQTDFAIQCPPLTSIASLLNGEEDQDLWECFRNTLPSSDCKVLVTGGAGFIGSHLCSVLLEQGCEVYAVDNLVTGRSENTLLHEREKRFHFVEMDINQPEFREYFADIPVSIIFHLACPTGVPNISLLSMEMLHTCSEGTFNVMEIAKRHTARVLYTSSCEVYGQPEVCPQHVGYTGNVDPVGPRCAYEEGKRFSESVLISYVRKYGIDARIVRVFNTYGPGMSPKDQRVIPRFLRSTCLGQPLVVYGDGSQTRTFVYFEDLIRGFLIALLRGESGSVFNIGGVRQISMRELAELVIKLTGHRKGIVYHPHFTEDHRMREPAVDEIRQLGWEQRVGLEEGLQHMIAARSEDGYYALASESVAAPASS